jgi:hypothetical protein
LSERKLPIYHSWNLKVKVDTLLKETAEIEAGIAENSTWDQANIRHNLGLVWRNRKKIGQIIKLFLLNLWQCIFYRDGKKYLNEYKWSVLVGNKFPVRFLQFCSYSYAAKKGKASLIDSYSSSLDINHWICRSTLCEKFCIFVFVYSKKFFVKSWIDWWNLL